jgi:hypothetical protein
MKRTRDVFLLGGFFPRLRFFVLALLLPLLWQEMMAVVTQKPGDFTGFEQIFHFVAYLILGMVVWKIIHLTLAQLAEQWRTEILMAAYNRHPKQEQKEAVAATRSPASFRPRAVPSRGNSFQNFAGVLAS